MIRHIYKCPECGKYTMKEICSCGEKTLIARPVKYSPADKFAEYKRRAKEQEYSERGLI